MRIENICNSDCDVHVDSKQGLAKKSEEHLVWNRALRTSLAHSVVHRAQHLYEGPNLSHHFFKISISTIIYLEFPTWATVPTTALPLLIVQHL